MAHVKALDGSQDVLHMQDNPIKASGHIQILKGNLASAGSVAKITGKEVFDIIEILKPHGLIEPQLGN